MFPLKDNVPSIRKPYVTIFIIIVNILVYVFQFLLTERQNAQLIYAFGFSPARLVYDLSNDGISSWDFLPIVSSMFLHGSWLHLLGNMWFLWLFGDNVEDRLGHFKFFVFYIASGAAAMLAHFIFNPGSPVPAVGASGAIAGVMGAYFILFPRAKITTVFLIVIIPIFINIPAIIYLFLWFVMQLYSGTINAFAGGVGEGVAWWAHIGGFLGGIALLKLMYTRRYRRPVYYDTEWDVPRRYPF